MKSIQQDLESSMKEAEEAVKNSASDKEDAEAKKV